MQKWPENDHLRSFNWGHFTYFRDPAQGGDSVFFCRIFFVFPDLGVFVPSASPTESQIQGSQSSETPLDPKIPMFAGLFSIFEFSSRSWKLGQEFDCSRKFGARRFWIPFAGQGPRKVSPPTEVLLACPLPQHLHRQTSQ